MDCGRVFPREATDTMRCPPCQRIHDQRTESARVRRRGGTVQRGYGTAHREARDQLLAQWQPGQPCAHCRQPMWTRENLDLAHTADRTGYRGLAHAACNRGNR
jgi:hypothetical protein